MLIGCLVLAGSECVGQTSDLKIGIYNSFYNFLHNRPIPAQVSVNYPPTDSIDALHYTYTASEFDLTEDRSYVSAGSIRIQWDLPVKRRQEIRQSMWGFYDGKHVYVSSRNYTNSTVVRYSRILAYGRYCYFLGAEEVYKKTAGAVGGLIGTLPLSAYFLLDLETGDIHKAEPLTVAEILKDYPNLHQQFQADRKDRKTLLKYIRAYNMRYAQALK